MRWPFLTSRTTATLFCALLLPATAAWAAPTLSTPAPAAANTTTAQGLSFHDALAQGQSANKSYQIAMQQERAARARWWQAILAMGPTASAQFGYILADKPMV